MIGIDPSPPNPNTNKLKAVRRSTRSRYGMAVTPRAVANTVRLLFQRLLRRGELRRVIEGRIPVLTTREVRVEISAVANDSTPVTATLRARNGYVNTHNVEWLIITVDGNVRYIPLYD